MSPLAQASRTLTRRAKALTVRNFTKGALDSYRDPALTPSTITIQGWIELRTPPLFVRDASGEQVQIDASAYVLENAAIGWSETKEKPEIVDEDGTEYVVQLVGKSENGIRELSIRKMKV